LITITIATNNHFFSPSLLREIFYPLHLCSYGDMIDLNNGKKNYNHTIPAATIFTLAIIIMTTLTITAPVAATTTATTTTTPQPVTVATDNQSVNVLISWEPMEIEPGEDTEFTLEFQEPSSGEPISHVNYNFEITDQNGGTVQSMTELHTHSGSDEQTVTFDTEGSFNLVATIIGTGLNPPFDTTQSGTAQTVIPVGQQLAGATEGGTTGGNATTAGTGGNQTDLRMNLEQARMALQNNDTQGAMMYLDMALSALGGNATTTAGGDATNATAALGGVTTGDEATGAEGGAEGGEGEGGG
jgi:hypothetical protein